MALGSEKKQARWQDGSVACRSTRLSPSWAFSAKAKLIVGVSGGVLGGVLGGVSGGVLGGVSGGV